MVVTEKELEKIKKMKVVSTFFGWDVDKFHVDFEKVCSCGKKNCSHVTAIKIFEGEDVEVSNNGLPTMCVDGNSRWDVVSAFHKELRRGDVKEAIYWIEVMIESEFPAFYMNNYIVSIIGEELCTCNENLDFIQGIKLLANYKVVDAYCLYAMVEKFCEAKKWWFCKKCSDRRDLWNENHIAVNESYGKNKIGPFVGKKREIPYYAHDIHTRKGKRLVEMGRADMRWSGTLKGMMWRRRVIEKGLDILKAEWDDVDMSDASEFDFIDEEW